MGSMKEFAGGIWNYSLHASKWFRLDEIIPKLFMLGMVASTRWTLEMPNEISHKKETRRDRTYI